MSIMKIFSNVWKKSKQTTHEVNEAIEDAMGTDIIEVDIRDAKKTIRKVTEEMHTIQAKVDIEKEEIDEIQAEKDRLESEIANLKVLHGDTEDEARKEEILSIAQEMRNEINTKIEPKLKAKTDAYEMTISSIKESQRIIDEQKSIVEAKELELDSIKANQSAINVHKSTEKIANAFGNEDGSGSADRIKKRQKEEMRKIQNKSQVKSKKADMEDRLNKIKSDGNAEPW